MSKVHKWFKGNDKRPFNKKLVLIWAGVLAAVCGIFYFIIFMNANVIDSNSSEVVFEETWITEDAIVFPIVHLTEDMANTFNENFNSTTNEFVYCLYGKTNKQGYFIDEIVAPVIISTSKNRVHFMSCKSTKDYIGTIHSHPKGLNCRLSVQDGISFGISSEKIGDKLAGVICGTDNFNMFTLTNTKVPLDLVIGEN